MSSITPIAALSDEFSDPASAASWTAEGFQNVSFDIGTTQSGALTFIAGSTPANTGWFENNEGPLMHRAASGNFIVMSYVVAGHVNDAAAPPNTGFNSAGLLVRAPSSTTGNQNWLMHNIGHQGGSSMAGCPNAGLGIGLGSEAKRTAASSSQLCLNPAASHRGRIAICRWGSSFHMLRRLDGESSWLETNVFTHPGMPSALDVGLIANFWTLPVSVRPQFDWIRSYAVSEPSVCSAASFDALFP